MAFPQVVASSTTDGSSVSATPVVNIGSPASGTLVIVLFRTAIGTAGVGWPGGWNELVEDSSDASNDATAIGYRLCDGTEGATITLATSSAKFAAIALQITGAANPASQLPELSTVAVGASDTPDPTTCTPTGGAKDYLWLWLGGWEGEATNPPAGNPTNYTNPLGATTGISGADAANCRVATARRELNASSEDAPLWTISVSVTGWTAWTMAVHPAGALNYNETGRLVSVTATVTATDSHDASEAVSVAVVATVTASDSIRNVEALSVSVASTVSSTDALSFGEAAAVAIASTVTATDQVDSVEASTVTITSTVTGTDVFTGGPQNYDETGRFVSVTATVTVTDQVDWTDALTVTAASTVTATDILTATDAAAFTIVSTVTGSDILSGAPINYNETGRLVSVASTITATDQVDVDENVTVTVASTVTGSDLLGFSEAATVTIVSTVTGDDLATLTDNVTVVIVATITVTDRITGPTFWQPNPAGYTVNPAAYVPVGPSDSPPW